MALTPKKRQPLDAIFRENGYADYKWIDPKKNHRLPMGAHEMQIRLR